MKLATASGLSLLLALSAAACVAESGEDASNESAVKAGDAGPAADAATDAGPAADATSDDPCANLAAGPFQPTALGQFFAGSEDFTFDGAGNIIGKRGTTLASVGPDGVKNLAELPGQTYGVRYLPNGSLLAAIPGAGKIVSVATDGLVTDVLSGLGSPNGFTVANDGTVYFTEFSGSKVKSIGPDGLTVTTLTSGSATAQGADGIVLDQKKNILFYNEYQKGKISRISLDTPGAAPVAVATITGAAVDGMTLDSCGNLYVVDNGRSRLFRVRLDEAGNATAAPELLATFPKNVAAANFGAGAGFDPKKLYLSGNPGVVYTVDVGVTGATVPVPAFAPPPPEKQP